MNRLIGVVALAACLMMLSLAYGDVGDPPGRIARLNYVQGSVSMQPGGVEAWNPASINQPLTIGDHLWVDANSRAEMHVGSTAIHVGGNTAVSYLNLDDRTVQIQLSQGSISIRIRYMADDDAYEVDTPNGAITLLRTGSYHIDANPDNQTTEITVHSGQAEVTSGAGAAPIHARQTFILTGSTTPSQDMRDANRPDEFDAWCSLREQREDNRPAARYVSTELPGYEDLDDHGVWRNVPQYGWAWSPTVEAGWAPYRNGHWAWVEPWGWTWIDDAPWGFAPFHYGRWAYVSGGWIWVPGQGVWTERPGVVVVARPVVVRPVYAPALVAFVGGNGWSASLAIGGGGGVAWFPLGPREPFIPAYHVSPTYVNRVNVMTVTNVTNVTTVTNVRYVNQTAPGAVTAVSRQNFVTSQPVQRQAFQVPASAAANAPVTGSAPAIAPTRQSFGGASSASASVAKPPAAASNRTVLTRTAPPPAPISFAVRQSALNANPGRPVDPVTLSNLRSNSPTPAPVRQLGVPPSTAGFRGNVTPPPTVVPSSPTPRPATAQTQPVQRNGFERPPNSTAAPSTPPPPRPSYERTTPPPQQPRPATSERPERTERQGSSKREHEKERKER